MIVELRSDTFTQPTAAMLQAMMAAPTGDDVFGEDPTVNELEQYLVQQFGMEAALFCPSGTMSNQIAIKCHTQPGDEVICDTLSHIYQYEGGGIAFNSGCSVKLLQGDSGRITADQVKAALNNVNDPHKAYSRLVSIENTVNMAGGTCYELASLHQIKEVCNANLLKLHLDGARLYNALVAKQQTEQQFGQLFDSISVCLSKGLGAPVGSVLLGRTDFIHKARRVRKVLGGGMRQAGYIAAAGLYALQHNVPCLALDHQHAQVVAAALLQKNFVKNILPVETNIVIFDIADGYSATELVHRFSQKGIRCLTVSPTRIRFVFHLGVGTAAVDYLLNEIKTM
jgi:threonine aldolase